MKRLKTLLFKNSSARQTFLKNASWYGLAQAVIQLFKFIIIPLSTRVLGSEQFGLFYYLLYLATAFYLFNDMGMPAFLVRALNQAKTEEDANSTLRTFLKTRVVFVFICFIFSFASLLIVEPEYRVAMLLCIAVIALDNFKKILINTAQSLKRDEIYSISSIMANGVLLLGAFLVLNFTSSLIAYIFVYVVYQALELVVLAVMLRPFIPKKASVSMADSIQLLRFSFPFFLTGMLSIILQVTDTLLIKHFLDLNQVGYFHAVLKLTMAMSILYLLIGRAIYPLLCEHSRLPERFSSITRNGLSLAALMAFPLLLGGILLGDKIVIFVFTERFIPGIPAFRGLLLALFLTFFISVMNSALLALHKEIQNAMISFVSVTINIVVSVALIGPYGIVGVAYGTALARCFDFVCSFTLLSRTVSISFIDWRSVFNITFGSIVMVVALFFLLPFKLHVMIMVMIGAVIYVLLLLILREQQLLKFLRLMNKNVLLS